MRGGSTSCSQSARSEPRKGVWCGGEPRPRARAPRCVVLWGGGGRAAPRAARASPRVRDSALIAGLRILGVEEGLPRLPDLEFAIYEKAQSDKAAAALAAVPLTPAPVSPSDLR